MGFPNDVKINFVLYSEKNWKDWSFALYDAGITQFKGKWFKRPYDGYTLFVAMAFDNLIADGDSIGVTIPLPNGDGTDLTNFGFTYNLAQNNYKYTSYFYSGSTGEVTPDHAWVCDTNAVDTSSSVGSCFHFQPEESDEVGPNYRWSYGDIIHPQGWTNISGNFKVFDIADSKGATLLTG